MAEPTTESNAEATELGPDEPEEPDDVDVATTTVADSGADPEGYFDDIDESAGENDVTDPFEGTDDPEGEEEIPTGDDPLADGLSDDINRGLARAAVIGLDDEWEVDGGETKQKTDLQDEFEETFEAFRLGHYAEICAAEYLLVEDDVHPAFGLLGASLICAAVIIWKRPDGDKVLDQAPGMGSLPDTAILNKFTNSE